MLNLFSKFTVPGVERVEVYQDDEDSRQFYMLPGKPSFALGPDGRPLISLIAFARDLNLMADVSTKLPSGETEGGLMSMVLECKVTPEERATIAEYIKTQIFGLQIPLLMPLMSAGVITFGRRAVITEEPKLSYPTWVDGTVTFSLMPAAGPTFIKAVEGSEKPSLTGTNLASYNVMLGEEGVRLMRESLKDGVVPGTINYSLSYMARIPNIHIEISGDAHDIYQELKEHVTIEETSGGRVVRRYPQVGSLHELQTKIANLHITYDKTNFPAMPGQDQAAVDAANKALENLVLDIAQGYLKNNFFTPSFSNDIAGKIGTDPLQNFKPAGSPVTGGNQLWLKDFTQEMNGQFDFTLDGRIAQAVSTYPNGLFYEIISPAEMTKHIVEADLNTPIFHILEVPVRVTADFENDPIAAIMVTLDYNQTDDLTGQTKTRTDTFTFQTGEEVFYFRTPMAKDATGAPKDTYSYTSRLNYKAATSAVTAPPESTRERSLIIGYDRMSCIRVKVVTGAIPWDVVERVAVAFTYRGTDLPTASQVFTLQADQSEASWFTYTGGNPSREYEYQLTFALKDGQKLAQPTTTSVSDRLVVDAPFGGQLNVTFVPQGTFPPLASIILTARYSTPASGYKVEDVHVFKDPADIWKWTVRLEDPSARTFEYKVDTTYADGSAHQGEWQPAAEGTVLVGEIASQMLQVEVVGGALDMAKWKLVIVRLTYKDPVTGQAQDETFQITPANFTDPMVWKIALRDPQARTYSYEIQAFGADGATRQSVPPTEKSDDLLVVEL